MRRKAFRDAALGLCTIGGALFAFGASKEAIGKLLIIPNVAFTVLLLAGGLLATIGIVAFFLSLIIDRLDGVVSRVAYGDLDSKYVCSHAEASDLGGLQTLYARYFGADVPEVSLMRAWLEKCASTFTIVQRVRQETGLATRQELVGSFKLVPLTRSGVRAVETGQVTGTSIRLEHIARDGVRPSAYYVGDVVATTRFARGVVMAHLNAAISTAAKGQVAVYARPLTADGLRIMTKHGFLRVADGKSAPQIGAICKLEIRGVARSSPRAQSRRRLAPLSVAPEA
jgi:hypothetical protein